MKGHIAKKKTGENTFRYYPVIDIVDAAGKRKRKWLQGCKTKKEAQTILNETLAEVQRGAYIEPSKMTVADFFDYWLDNYVKTNCAATSFERYKYTIDAHFIPYLGQLKLAGLKPLHIQRYFTHALTEGHSKKEGGLSKITVEGHYAMLRGAFNQAVKWELMPKNIMDSVEKPRGGQNDMQILSFEQVNALLNQAEKTQYYGIILMAIHTGMRKGEILGLRWQDVNLDTGMVSIKQTYQRIIGVGRTFQEPKTPQSRRTISVPPSVIEAMKKIRVKQAEYKLRFGAEYHQYDLVFCQKNGNPSDQAALRKSFNKMLTRANLPHIRFHDLRHTHASLLLMQGVPIKVVQERLGHATPSRTLNTYSHVMPNLQSEAARMFEERLTSTKTSTDVGRSK